jgi:hypothetical protein
MRISLNEISCLPGMRNAEFCLGALDQVGNTGMIELRLLQALAHAAIGKARTKGQSVRQKAPEKRAADLASIKASMYDQPPDSEEQAVQIRFVRWSRTGEYWWREII